MQELINETHQNSLNRLSRIAWWDAYYAKNRRVEEGLNSLS